MYMKVFVGIFFGVGICMYLYVSAGICWYLSVCYRHRYFAVSRMYVYVGICMYLYVCVHISSVSACIASTGPLGHGNHHSVPKTPSLDPAPGGTHSGHPRACARPLFDPIPTPSSYPIFRFFKNLCLDLSCHGHRIRPNALDRPKLCPIALPSA